MAAWTFQAFPPFSAPIDHSIVGFVPIFAPSPLNFPTGRPSARCPSGRSCRAQSAGTATRSAGDVPPHRNGPKADRFASARGENGIRGPIESE